MLSWNLGAITDHQLRHKTDTASQGLSCKLKAPVGFGDPVKAGGRLPKMRRPQHGPPKCGKQRLPELEAASVLQPARNVKSTFRSSPSKDSQESLKLSHCL